jgi:hypothetical protein
MFSRVARVARIGMIGIGLSIGALLAACNGCRRDGKGNGNTVQPETGPASVRIYVLSDIAGALEPCGCQKDMLGGVDHFAALVAKERDKSKGSIVVAAGPTFFENVTPKPERAEQDLWKAEALASGLKGVGFGAFSPGGNDWSQGADTLVKLRDTSSGAVVAANLGGASSAGAVGHVMKDIAGVKVAFVGVASPRTAAGAIAGITIDDATKALAAEANKARAEGARIVVGLASIDRGDAVRAAEQVPDLDVLAIGSPSLEGDANDEPKPPRFVGNVLIVEPSNHLTRASIIDFYVRGDGKFADGSGLSRMAEVTDLTTQIDDLVKRIANWEKDPNVPKSDLEAQKARLQTMREKLAKAQVPPPTPTGSFLRYDLVDVRENLGIDPEAKKSMKSYYERVNEFNKKKFAGRKAPAPAKGEPQYVGVDVCKTCHIAAFAVWSKTGHGSAYKTLADDSKEFNLDCVSCHVTAYEKPSGSTVTDVAVLKDVQCEQCHGPGSAHAADPYASQLSKAVEEQVCTGCHHPPHTDIFDYKVRLEKIKGPGHGLPGAPTDVEPPKGWKPPPLRF